MDQLSLIFAFSAGLVSFLAPCVLPLIPGYLSYLAGTTLNNSEANRLEVFLNSVFFVLGFSSVFSLLGVLLNSVLSQVAYDVQTWLSRIGGLIIIFFGIYMLGLIKLTFLATEHKFNITQKFNSRYLTSFLFGASFAVGWTPCVGAVLGSILSLAATQPGSAFTLLFAYSLGLGIPFLLVGLFASQASHLIARFGRFIGVINILFGLVLIGIGILIFAQSLSLVANLEIINSLILNR